MSDTFTAEGGELSIIKAILGIIAEHLEAAFDEMLTKYGTIENYFSEALGIDLTMQKDLGNLYPAPK